MTSNLKNYQRNHYDRLAEIREKSNIPFSCSFEERYNPFLLVNNIKMYHFFYDIFTKKLPDRKGVVLDCCSGSGIYLPLLANFSEVLVGLDLSYGLLNESKKILDTIKLPKTITIQSEAETIPMKSNSCDLIVMIDSFHHIESPEAVLEELSRVAKKDASFLLIEPNVNNPLVFLSHFIPKEERGAIKRNTKTKLVNMLKPYVNNIQISPINYVAANKSGLIANFIAELTTMLFASVFKFWPIRLLVFGQFTKES
jgi:ubiquinone/menaquinone biosynthesis C-methylase UbiE